MLPQFPIYIPTKGRQKSRLTAKYLDLIGVKYRLVIEPQEYSAYLAEVKDKKKLLVMDMSYKDKYRTCSNDNTIKSTGAGAARNFIWDHSISEGYKWHWTMDDNIVAFYRFNKNLQIKVTDGSIFRAMEDFSMRYKNVAMAGPHYLGFIMRKNKYKPFSANCRIYSCNLIRNDIPFRWRGRYNEDVILSLDILKAGWCTIQFNAFLQDKVQTQLMKGGNTDVLYHGGIDEKGNYSKTGTIEKSLMLQREHPDVTKVVKRWGRVHHYVDYTPFKKNKLIKKDNLTLENKINNYGMVLKKI